MNTNLHFESTDHSGASSALSQAVSKYCGLVNTTYQRILLESQGKPLSERILALIQGTKKTRLTGGFSDAGKTYLLEQIESFVCAGLPIEFLTFTSARKYKAGHDVASTGPDTLELSTALHIEELSEAIKAIYEPGIHFTIVADDHTGNTLFPGHEEVIRTNVPRLEQLMTTVSGSIQLITESSLFEDKGIPLQKYEALVDELSHPFFDFLWETRDIDDDAKHTASSFGALTQMGWKGIIPQQTRSFYLSKIERTHGDISEREKIQWLARFFATVMAKVTNRIGYHSDRDAIRCTFAAPVPGSPVSFGRPHFQSLVGGDERAPFWVGDGGVKFDPEGGFSLASFSRGGPSNSAIVSATVQNNGSRAGLFATKIAL